MALLLGHPEVAYRPCEMCKAWMYNHETGEQVMKGGKPVPRVPGIKLPCEMAIGQAMDVRRRACAKVSPDAGIELSDKNWQVYQHYRECKAIGEFPDDPIVRHNAAIIQQVEESQKELRQSKLLGLLATRAR